jgi:hypothetical protein
VKIELLAMSTPPKPITLSEILSAFTVVAQAGFPLVHPIGTPAIGAFKNWAVCLFGATNWLSE